jgi:hypothetical protein
MGNLWHQRGFSLPAASDQSPLTSSVHSGGVTGGGVVGGGMGGGVVVSPGGGVVVSPGGGVVVPGGVVEFVVGSLEPQALAARAVIESNKKRQWDEVMVILRWRTVTNVTNRPDQTETLRPGRTSCGRATVRGTSGLG